MTIISTPKWGPILGSTDSTPDHGPGGDHGWMVAGDGGLGYPWGPDLT